MIARQTFKLRRNPEDTVEVGLVSLTVTGKIATLRLVVTPNFKSAAADEAISLYHITENSGFRPYLLDLEHLKRYDLLTASGSRTLSSDEVELESVNGTPMAAYGVFAAPQDGATSVDVFIADWWPPFKAVRVQQ